MMARKRFWKSVDVQSDQDGFSVLLDGRNLRTPAKAELKLPTLALAEAIAGEWDETEQEIDPARMPLTRSANSAIDKLSVQFDEVVNLLAEYAGSDLLCYRADGPQTLIERQNKAWDPWLDWAGSNLGAKLIPVIGVMHRAQNPTDLNKLRDQIRAHSAFELASLHDLITLTGSCVLGLAMSKGALAASEAWQLSRLDELWQAEFWGSDDEAEATAEKKLSELMNAEQFLRYLREG